jgi:hypothetical protein
VIGGQAITAYSKHRTTYDLDILLSRSSENASKLMKIINIDDKKSLRALLTQENKRLPYPSDTDKVADLFTSIERIDFAKLFANGHDAIFNGIKLKVPCVEDLILMKNIARETTNDLSSKKRNQFDIDELLKLIRVHSKTLTY